ncbi:MAG: hypothetical protein M1815_003408 [Lichina confinis]|nr:MAG: hypothetical protein M1815_003408 [Lichina confinis]
MESPNQSSVSGKDRLTESEQATLIEKSIRVKANAYCPHSRFRVGACVLAADKQYFAVGCNVENASYGLTFCAERAALSRAVTDGHRKFKALAVSSDISPAGQSGISSEIDVSPDADIKAAVAPCCGACLQWIREFCPPEFPIFLVDVNGKHIVKTLIQLLPYSFGPENLLPPPGRFNP